MPKRFAALVLLPAFLSACAGVASVEPQPQPTRWHGPVSVVPEPARLQVRRGPSYRWPQNVGIDARDPAERNAATFLRAFLDSKRIDSQLRTQRAGVVIRHLSRGDRVLGAEGYRLNVRGDRITIRANTAAGLFYGVQTLEQLTAGDPRLVTTPVTVVDWPQYRWRGIHLDVSRHFFGVRTIERYIDIAAHYKLNVFHWHLTDDQAWRLQIIRYPRLTRGGPYYTQAQVREIVRYAARRGVTIVPEIEMPGHAAAARRAYPYSVALIEDVLREVIALFPGRYIHIGGDEVAYTRPQVEMMAQVVRFLSAHGRRAVAWDDALAASPEKSTLLMAWRGEKREIAALARGYDVVVSRDGPLYFDAYQGARAQEPFAPPHMATLEEVYSFNPQPEGASRRVYGAQANVWTEHIASPAHLFYMLLPRELALAEIAWDAPQRKNWPGFLARLPAQLDELQQRGYAFRTPNVLFIIDAPQIAFAPVAGDPQAARALTTAQAITVRLQGMGAVYYTTDASQPSQRSKRYTQPFRLVLPASGNLMLRAVAFRRGGQRSGITTCIVARTTHAPPRRGFTRTWAGLISP